MRGGVIFKRRPGPRPARHERRRRNRALGNSGGSVGGPAPPPPPPPPPQKPRAHAGRRGAPAAPRRRRPAACWPLARPAGRWPASLGEQEGGAGVARAWRGRGAGYRLRLGMSGAGVARISCSPWGRNRRELPVPTFGPKVPRLAPRARPPLRRADGADGCSIVPAFQWLSQ
eukprot:gene24193-biopygen2889